MAVQNSKNEAELGCAGRLASCAFYCILSCGALFALITLRNQYVMLKDDIAGASSSFSDSFVASRHDNVKRNYKTWTTYEKGHATFLSFKNAGNRVPWVKVQRKKKRQSGFSFRKIFNFGAKTHDVSPILVHLSHHKTGKHDGTLAWHMTPWGLGRPVLSRTDLSKITAGTAWFNRVFYIYQERTGSQFVSENVTSCVEPSVVFCQVPSPYHRSPISQVVKFVNRFPREYWHGKPFMRFSSTIPLRQYCKC